MIYHINAFMETETAIIAKSSRSKIKNHGKRGITTSRLGSQNFSHIRYPNINEMVVNKIYMQEKMIPVFDFFIVWN
ncbi:MAG: hypothetical protein PHS92_04265 [Candidatus Gracilibacteria bacterium]|nr:hypothetical protein [Candidatus Gracilibacteria bacterium]